MPQLFLTTDIHLAGLLFPAFSSDPLFFACPGWVQQNWFFFFFLGLFSFCFQSFCLEVPCTYLPAPSALLWGASTGEWLGLGRCKLSFDTRALGLNSPSAPAQIAHKLLGCLLHCAHVYESHGFSSLQRKGCKACLEGKKKGFVMKAGFCPRQQPCRAWLCSFSAGWGFSALWGWKERVMGHIHCQLCLILPKKRCRHKLLCWDPNAGANFY